MLPDNTLSSQLVYAPFVQAKVAQHSVPLVDYELGGIAIGEPSAGLDVQLWTARYIGNDVVVFDEAGNGTTIITVPGIKRLSLAFDQNMRPLIAYSTLVGSYLYWFDTFLNAFTTTEVPGASFLRLTLDERRFQFLNNSDVILAYHVGNSLRYRQQRDRFETERTLVADMGTSRLTAIGTGRNYRLQFKVKGDYLQPPPPPPPAPVTWSPADKSPLITLSSGDLVATRTGATDRQATVRATQSRDATDAGGYYFEVVVTSGTSSNFIVVGVATSAQALDNYVGSSAASWAYYQQTGEKYTAGAGSAYGASYTTGDVVGVLLKNGKLYFRKNGTWQNSADVGAETGAAFTGLSGNLFPAVSMYRSLAPEHILTARFNAADFSGSLPSGVKAWES